MTTTTPDERPAKQVWVRCKGSGTGDSAGCKQRVFNHPIDIELHRQHCPADLERDVKALARRLEALEKAREDAPALPDLDDVSEDWPAAESPAEDDLDGYVGEPAESGADEDDDELDEDGLLTPAAVTARRF